MKVARFISPVLGMYSLMKDRAPKPIKPPAFAPRGWTPPVGNRPGSRGGAAGVVAPDPLQQPYGQQPYGRMP